MTQVWIAANGILKRRGYMVEDAFTLGVTKPNGTNTGADTSLIDATLTGNQTFSVAGQTISNKRIYGYVNITAPNVTLDNCEILGGTSFSATAYPGYSGQVNCSSSGAVINRCTIRPTHPWYFVNGISGTNFTAHRCNISQVCDGISARGGVAVQGCYIHDLAFFDGANTNNGNGTDHETDGRFPGWSHNDCIQIYGGSNNIVEGTYIEAYFSSNVGTPATAMTNGNPNGSNNGRLYPKRNYSQGVFASPTNDVITNCIIKNNWFEGGEFGWASTPQNRGFDSGNSYSITGNRFGADQKPGYTGNPTNPYTQFYYYPTLGSFTISNNMFDAVASVPAEYQGQPVMLNGTFSGQTKYEIMK